MALYERLLEAAKFWYKARDALLKHQVQPGNDEEFKKLFAELGRAENYLFDVAKKL